MLDSDALVVIRQDGELFARERALDVLEGDRRALAVAVDDDRDAVVRDPVLGEQDAHQPRRLLELHDGLLHDDDDGFGTCRASCR